MRERYQASRNSAKLPALNGLACMGIAPSHRRVRFGSFEVDEIAGELRKDGVKLRLQENLTDSFGTSRSAAEAECRRAVELDRENPWAALGLALCLVTTGRSDEGIAEAVRLVHLDPISPLRWAVSGLLYHCRRYDKAIAQAMKCVEMENQYAQARWTIAISQAAIDGPDRGIAELEKVVIATDENSSFLAHSAIATRRRNGAQNRSKF